MGLELGGDVVDVSGPVSTAGLVAELDVSEELVVVFWKIGNVEKTVDLTVD